MDILKYQLRSFEKIPVRIYDDGLEASKNVAKSISLAIRQKQQEGEYMVLGLATGSTPIKVYQELIRMHKTEELSFKNVITFNLDEYYPMKKDDDQSYWKFMHEHLFNHIDIDPKNIHIPNGELPIDQVEEYCRDYEEKIDALGGIDIQLLGIGRTGHIGFNEPGSWESSRTRLVKLDHLTRQDATKSFITEEKVPYRAITMGIDTILKAKTIYVMAFGQQKADILVKTVEGKISASCPATYLQKHGNTRFLVDENAASQLTKVKTPWSVGLVNWSDELICRAVVWLASKVGKPILKLTDEDYNINGLSDLILEYDSAYNINIRIFNRLQHTITGWPGGKPNADDSQRPERAKPSKKRVVIFSPHPDDDVISMGGTFIRLVEQGHEVHVAYQTSGNIAVHDHDVMRFSEFIKDVVDLYEIDAETANKKYEKIRKSLESKKGGEADISLVRDMKGMIRRGEARAGARIAGAKDENIHFLDLPFYETGKVKKSPVGKKDVEIIKKLLQEIKPHQIYAAGDLADPHGTHKVCLDAIFGACEELKKEAWFKDCWLWLYRGAWHEWGIDEIEMAVPLSPDEVLRKRMAIFMHQSQKDRAPFPGNDEREFWQRAEDRNRETANLYNAMGLAEYEAMEAFVKWKFETNSLK
ncbi:glucosamine-6-phosphate deaminase [Membranihabitans marinus]|uniref:glucosamine-6-phosphate deaminase n=1 Tax=Membranihabitans marinus TaxID=1227546 RepID=UPI001F00E888|nr:glucosamine-6-phosphate deaminase [Membranihabitans marinus]